MTTRERRKDADTARSEWYLYPTEECFEWFTDAWRMTLDNGSQRTLCDFHAPLLYGHTCAEIEDTSHPCELCAAMHN